MNDKTSEDSSSEDETPGATARSDDSDLSNQLHDKSNEEEPEVHSNIIYDCIESIMRLTLHQQAHPVIFDQENLEILLSFMDEIEKTLVNDIHTTTDPKDFNVNNLELCINAVRIITNCMTSREFCKNLWYEYKEAVMYMANLFHKVHESDSIKKFIWENNKSNHNAQLNQLLEHL